MDSHRIKVYKRTFTQGTVCYPFSIKTTACVLKLLPKRLRPQKMEKPLTEGNEKKKKKTTSGDIVTETEKEGRRKHLFLHWDDDDDR